jgi:hypothetical protein
MSTFLFCQLPAALLSLSAALADPAKPTQGLTHLALKSEAIDVYYSTKHAAPMKQAPTWTKEYDKVGVYASVPLLLDMGERAGKLVLACDSGPSADPSCYLLRDAENPESRVFEAPGTRFSFLDDGRVLVGGHSDNMYDHRRLYTFEGNKFVEAVQPMRYVGVESKAKAAIALHAEKATNSATTMTFAAGSAFTILLNDNASVDDNGQNPDYLVRTSEGIVGWVHLPSKPDGSTDAEGLFFRGD